MLKLPATYLLAAAFITSLIFTLDPNQAGFGLYEFAIFKYLPIILGNLSALLFLLSCGPNCFGMTPSMLIIFAAYVLGGSLYTTFVIGHDPMDSFLGRGLAIFTFFAAFRVNTYLPAINIFNQLILKLLPRIGLLIAFGIYIWALGYHFVNQPHVYHTQVIIPLSSVVILYMQSRVNSLYKIMMIIILLFSGLALYKNTGIIGTISIFILLLYLLLKQPRKIADYKIIAILVNLMAFSSILLLITIFMSFSWLELYAYLPSGSTAVRLNTYAERFTMISENPFFGEYFVGSPLMTLPTIEGDLVIPSHSDILDIIAFGGVVGLALFIIPVLKGIKSCSFIINSPYRINRTAALWSLVYVTLNLINFGFNATWIRPEMSTLFMISLGLLLGFHSQHGAKKMRDKIK